MLIKIGNFILNPQHIVWAEILPEEKRVRLCLTTLTESQRETYPGSEEHLATSVSDTITFDKTEAEALIKFLCDPNRTEDLCPDSHEVEDYQAYRQRGGNMTYEDFGVALRRQQRLCAIENPSVGQLHQCCELEGKLLL
jgi:hypothetical protein